jgi:predicted extracellular nuclease
VKALARQVIDNLKTPDIILCQELENQDIAKVESGKLAVTTQNHADGKPDTAQEVCLAIKAAGGPDYDCTFDPVAGDDRGIVTAFLYRTDRVALAKPDAAPALGAGLKVDYAGTPAKLEGSLPRNPRAINAQLPPNIAAEDQEAEGALVFTRAAQVAAFDVYPETVGKGEAQRVYAVNNHLSSIPNKRVTQRTEQARLLASIMTAISKTGENVLALAAGDFNVYPRPDDPFRDKPSDQLAALYAAGLYNVYDTLLKEVPASAYSYVYEGEAQTLDQMYLTPALKAKLVQPRVAHINADFSEGEQELGVAGARRASDHDPLVVRFKF